VFTTKGLAIKTIDKNSGVITTDNTSFINSYTYETKDGNLANPYAMVVCNKVRGLLTLSSLIKPDVITGQWAIRVKEDGNRTIVDTKLANVVGKVVIQNPPVNVQTVAETHNLIVKSTGVFEKTIEDVLK
jgi:L-arabinose isomerase